MSFCCFSRIGCAHPWFHKMASLDDRLLDVAYKSDDDDSEDERLLPATDVTVRPHRCVLLEVPVFLYFVALVTQYPVLQFYLYDRFSEELGVPSFQNESDTCTNSSNANHSSGDAETQIQTKTSEFVMYMSFICNFVAIIPTLLLGRLTDKFGRKFVVYVSSAGLIASQVLTIAVFHCRLATNLLFLTSLLQGVTGSFGLYLAAIFGMVADFTTPGKQRAFRVTTMEAAIAVSSSVGTTTSGIWVKEMGYIWPLVFAVSLIIVAVMFVIFLVPETLVERRHHPITCLSFIKCFEFYVKDTPTKRRFKMIVCAFCFMTVIGCFIGESNFSMLYLLHQPFCWAKMKITIFNGTFVLLKWVATLSILHVGKRWISEPVFAIMGSMSLSIGYLLRGLAWDDILIYIGATISILSDMVSPMMRTVMSKSVSASEQGALFAGIGVLQMVVSSVAGIALSAIYNEGLKVYLGLPYVVIGGVVFINVILLIVLIIRMRYNPAMAHPAEIQEQVVN